MNDLDHMPSNVLTATTRRCIEEQAAARNAHVHVFYHMRDGLHDRASAAQEVAADCYKQMWMRLERLIGVA